MFEQCPSLQAMMPVRPKHSLLLLQLYRFSVSRFACGKHVTNEQFEHLLLLQKQQMLMHYYLLIQNS